MKRLIWALAVLFALRAASARAAFEERPASARAAALAESLTAAAGIDGLASNPAAGRFAESVEAYFGRVELFGLEGLTDQRAAVLWPTARAGAWGFSAGQFGPAFYRERQAALSHSFFLSTGAALGWSLTHSSLALERYGNKSAVGIDLGVRARLHPRAHVGLSARNVNGPRFGGLPEGPAGGLRAGLAFRPAAAFQTFVDMVKPARGDLSWRAGQEIALGPLFTLRVGLRTAPNRFAFGFGARAGPVWFDYALMGHAFLDDQHHVSLSYRLGPAPVTPEISPPPPAARKKKKKPAGKTLPESPLDLNTASLAELTSLPGIGETTARKIIERRDMSLFVAVEELLDIPRFPKKKFLLLRPALFVAPPAPEAAAPSQDNGP